MHNLPVRQPIKEFVHILLITHTHAYTHTHTHTHTSVIYTLYFPLFASD